MGKVRERELRQLARLHGVQTEYVDMWKQRHPARPEALLRVLQVLGAPVERPDDVGEALRQRQKEPWRRLLPPVGVAWDGSASSLPVRLVRSHADRPAECLLRSEDGSERRWALKLEDLETLDAVDVDGTPYVSKGLPLPEGLPTGYHRLRLEVASGESGEIMLISAPTRAYDGMKSEGTTHGGERLWGVFCPLYALHRETSWGAGDFSDLEALVNWTSDRGGDLVATLPLLASFLDDPAGYSPYSPASRLFWNEFYLDIPRIPELEDCSEARHLLESTEVQQEIAELRKKPRVDYARQHGLKQRLLQLLSEQFFSGTSTRRESYEQFVRRRPDVEDYAFFRAAGERYGRDWKSWPQALRDARSRRAAGSSADIDEQIWRYHCYVQWQTDEQLQSLADGARRREMNWYVDFPLGVDSSSYDVWRERESFVLQAAGGSPPDPVFTKGQNWGFPPFHPDRLREQAYGYWIACLQQHFRYANALRIDHVMGLHRLFCIPHGSEANDGVYIEYPADELYAVLSVESHRHQTWLVGENLGTVPPAVNRSMRQHAVHGMYVVQYEVRSPPEPALPRVPKAVVASLNTHDMPPFASFWQGLDIDDRLDLGLLDETTAAQERQKREAQRQSVMRQLRDSGFLDAEASDVASIIRACSEFLAASPAHVALLNLEDLWEETEPQNTPNTLHERPNWQRKTKLTFEEFSSRPAVLEFLDSIADLRRPRKMKRRSPTPRPDTGVPTNP